MKVIIGGTFAYLHKGHKALIGKAFELGDQIYIGLTTDEYVRKMKHPTGIPSYQKREGELKKFVKGFGKKFEVMPIHDKFGPSTTDDFDLIVVSDETLATAEEINRMRREGGRQELTIVKVDYVLAEDSLPISTTRIIKGEIDREGKLVK
ncbi:MAG: pantetheine-phosphate adenylyltransferase [Candidatus Micrarchaeota archaeon]|nr:pantetheine-phosphate adenylyltransferase [Candidatus Micrarchaeota archaeon]